MGGLIRRRDAVPRTNILGMNSEVAMAKDIRRERDREVSRRHASEDVVEAEQAAIERTAIRGVQRMERVNRVSELCASTVPHQGHRVDAIANAAAVLMCESMGKVVPK